MRKILIVEDDEQISDCMQDAVLDALIAFHKMGGLLVPSVSCTSAAIRALNDEKGGYDAVILDMGLPEKDGRMAAKFGGLVVLDHIRKNWPQMPVVIFSAQPEKTVAHVLNRYTVYADKSIGGAVREVEKFLSEIGQNEN